MTMSWEQFRSAIRQQHQQEFSLHRELAMLVEREVISKSRSHPDAVSLVLDMLIVQAYKAHLTAAVVGELGHLEDMATIARRLFELAIQSIYIGGDGEEATRLKRANQFIAYLWDSVPESRKKTLPPAIASDWEAMANEAGVRNADRVRWGPPFATMFEYAGHRDLYDQDYKFLSALAHGSSEALIVQYSLLPIPVRSTDYVGTLLIYSSKYYLNVLDHWIRLYRPSLSGKFDEVAKRLRQWSLPSRQGSD